MKQILIISALIIPVFMTHCNQESGIRDFEIKDFEIMDSGLPDTFLLGSHLCRVPMPPEEEMLRDMVVDKPYVDMNTLQITSEVYAGPSESKMEVPSGSSYWPLGVTR